MWKKVFKRYNSWKLGHKLLCAFLLASIIPLLVVQVLTFQMNRKQMTEKIDELMVNNLTQIAERVNLNMDVYTNLLYQIYKDELVIDNVLSLIDDSESRKAVAYNQIVKRLKQYRNSEAGIRCMSVVCPNGAAVIYDFETDSSLNTIWHNYSDMRQIPPYRESIDAPGMVLTDTMNFQGEENDGHFFHISKRLFDFNNLDQGSIGTVIMSVDQKILSAICGNNSMEDRSINFILNEDWRVMSYPDEDFTGNAINPQLTLVKLDTKFPWVNTYTLDVTNVPEDGMEVLLRVPDYAQNYRVCVRCAEEGAKESAKVPRADLEKGYYRVSLKKDSKIEVTFDAPPKFVYANPQVRADSGKTAIVRGPLVYCLEEADNGQNLPAIFADTECTLSEETSELFGGIVMIKAKGKKIVESAASNSLYSDEKPKLEDTELTLIPYPYWNNRGVGEMLVWMKQMRC